MHSAETPLPQDAVGTGGERAVREEERLDRVAQPGLAFWVNHIDMLVAPR